MKPQFDPEGDPTQTTPAEFVMSVRDLTRAVQDLVQGQKDINGRLGNGQQAFDRIGEQIHGLKNREQVTSAQVTKLLEQSVERDKKIEENTEITADIRIWLENFYEAFKAIDAATKPFRWAFAKTFAGMRWVGEQGKWVVGLVGLIALLLEAIRRWGGK